LRTAFNYQRHELPQATTTGRNDVMGRDLVRQIRARLAAWEAARGTGRRYYSTEDLQFLPSLAASDPIVTGAIRCEGELAPASGEILVEGETLELFERKLHELEASGWKMTSPIDLAENGQTVRCLMRRGRRRARRTGNR
jgi:hypothetical protein